MIDKPEENTNLWNEDFLSIITNPPRFFSNILFYFLNLFKSYISSLLYNCCIQQLHFYLFLSIIFVIFCCSIVGYLIFYHYYALTPLVTLPLYFDFNTTHPSANCSLYTQHSNFDIFLDLFGEKKTFLLYPEHYYNIGIELIIYNNITSLFTIQSTLYLYNNDIELLKSSRPLAITPDHNVGFNYNTETELSKKHSNLIDYYASLFENYVEDDHFPSTSTTVVITLPYNIIYKGFIHFHLIMHGIQYFITHYYIISFLLGVSSLFFIQIFYCFVFLLLFYLWKKWRRDDEIIDTENDEELLFSEKKIQDRIALSPQKKIQ